MSIAREVKALLMKAHFFTCESAGSFKHQTVRAHCTMSLNDDAIRDREYQTAEA